MNPSTQLVQDPGPGAHLLRFRGDTLTFTLTLPDSEKGSAWLRTTIGHGAISRDETIANVRLGKPRLGRDWFDIPMQQTGDRHFKVTIPLCEVGHYEAKCFFLNAGGSTPVWPQGSNTVINVEPADTCCGNILYNAFVRQFGLNKDGGGVPDSKEAQSVHMLDQADYTVIPKSGTFRDLIAQLDFIVGRLGCRILQLLPIHPTPTTYGRMGRFGSPFAALSFTAVDPALAEFDPKATPLEQFLELVDAVHLRNAKIFIDIAINHTGWAAALHESHPHWLVRDPDGRIEVPGAWGVRWEDLTKLDYSQKDLWQYMADVFLTWCHRGVDGFRCDAGYMIPVSAWKYIIAQVRRQFPDTIFFLEGLGGKISVTRNILNQGNFDWAYSELFQNYDRSQIEGYLPEAFDISRGDGIMLHFAETHDNPRLAGRSKTYARMRTALCALCSSQGAFGFANGVEWYATEKINVHEAPSLNWGAADNQVDHISRISDILKQHPAFHDQTDLKMIQQGEGNCLVLLRHHLSSGKKLLVVANLDDSNPTSAAWNYRHMGITDPMYIDLITEDNVAVTASAEQHTLGLEPGQVLCLTADSEDLNYLKPNADAAFLLPDRIERQQMRAKALDVFVYYHGTRNLGEFDPDQAAALLARNPRAYCLSLNHAGDESRVITWQYPRDVGREVMVPPGHFLLVRAGTRFRSRIMEKKQVVGYEESLPLADGSFFALFAPLPEATDHRALRLNLSVYTNEGCQHVDAPLLYLSRAEDIRVQTTFDRSDLISRSMLMLGTNGRGGMLRAHVDWGRLTSRYDALLAANLNGEFPEDRWIMLARCRAWLVFQGYSQAINSDCQDSFHFDYSRGLWRFHVPTGQGEYVVLAAEVKMIQGENAIRMTFYRYPSAGNQNILSDDSPVRLILRPDIEDRNFHETTKAYLGPEDHWPQSVTTQSDGFAFAPDANRRLQIQISRGRYIPESEWQYMVHRPIEKERGLDPDSDLFSPGYFSAELKGGEGIELTARVSAPAEPKTSVPKFEVPAADPMVTGSKASWRPGEALQRALEHYIVKRGTLKSVIAGFPWFLDWGRDSLIVVRGLIASGRTRDARAVIKQFGRFEADGTLPNMIRGQDAGNRDTSDAPLWFFLACSELSAAEGSEAFLDESCHGRTIRQILISMARSMIAGTPNGIRMDPQSGLIFSPAHFTWMDTNHPVGSPRQGYPIEIQSLWHAALVFLARIDSAQTENKWKSTAKKVQASVLDLFMLKEGWLADCLHAQPGTPAAKAERDDALRPNQLFAVTLDAIADTTTCRKIVTACQELLVPGAIRSLADRPVRYPLPIVHNGNVINDPHHPYQGKYVGHEDLNRKPAYHNGTAWTWVLPTFCEAWVKAYGKPGTEAALAWLSSGFRLTSTGCVGHLPEILDGDFPHTERGCDAQAWGVSELLRVWIQLTGEGADIF
jgi:predicted glycogen debranching enzyme